MPAGRSKAGELQYGQLIWYFFNKFTSITMGLRIPELPCF